MFRRNEGTPFEGLIEVDGSVMEVRLMEARCLVLLELLELWAFRDAVVGVVDAFVLELEVEELGGIEA